MLPIKWKASANPLLQSAVAFANVFHCESIVASDTELSVALDAYLFFSSIFLVVCCPYYNRGRRQTIPSVALSEERCCRRRLGDYGNDWHVCGGQRIFPDVLQEVTSSKKGSENVTGPLKMFSHAPDLDKQANKELYTIRM